MKVWQFAAGFVGAATVAASTVVWWRGKKRNKILRESLNMDSLLSADRTRHEDEIPTPEDIKYCNRVKERMQFGKTCVHPPLYGGDSGADED